METGAPMPHHVASLPSAGSQARTQLNVPAVTTSTARTISSLRVNVRSVQLIVLLSIACLLCLRLSTELIRIGTCRVPVGDCGWVVCRWKGASLSKFQNGGFPRDAWRGSAMPVRGKHKVKTATTSAAPNCYIDKPSG